MGLLVVPDLTFQEFHRTAYFSLAMDLASRLESMQKLNAYIRHILVSKHTCAYTQGHRYSRIVRNKSKQIHNIRNTLAHE